MRTTTLIGALLLACVLGTGCSSPDQASRALTDAGYTNIQITGYEWWGCGKDDTFSTGFRAKGPTGRPAHGVVCSGWWKGSTIRLF